MQQITNHVANFSCGSIKETLELVKLLKTVIPVS